MEKIALIGFHDKLTLEGYACNLELRKYGVVKVDSRLDLISELGKRNYDLVLMDANLDNPNSSDVGPSVEAFELIRERYDREEVKFCACSLSKETVKEARSRGVPSRGSST